MRSWLKTFIICHNIKLGNNCSDFCVITSNYLLLLTSKQSAKSSQIVNKKQLSDISSVLEKKSDTHF